MEMQTIYFCLGLLLCCTILVNCQDDTLPDPSQNETLSENSQNDTLPDNSQKEDPRVTIELGELIGNLVQVNDPLINKSFVVKEFLGVPYAKPPVGDLRFRKPEPVEACGDCNIMCQNKSDACFQFTMQKFPMTLPTAENYTSEDCLYLNVWVPEDASPQNKKSVFFFIHGGFFRLGSARHPVYHGKVMAALGDVIVVTINYRLGSLGFWTNNGTEAPPNIGIWDTIEALKWVNKYIEEFGGDKNSITIGGVDAGAVIVSLLAVTPYANGLYQRQIVQSGSAMWELMKIIPIVHQSYMLALRFGCVNRSPNMHESLSQSVDCMKDIDGFELLKVERFLKKMGYSFLPMWGDELFPTNPQEALLEGNFPFTELLIGNSGNEGASYITLDAANRFNVFLQNASEYDRDAAESLFHKLLPNWMRAKKEVKSKSSAEDVAAVTLLYEKILKNMRNKNRNFTKFEEKKELVKAYLPVTNESDFDWKLKVADAYADLLFVCPTANYASAAVQSGTKVFYYDFQYRPSNSPWAEWVGPTHFDEVDFIFGGPLQSPSRYLREEMRLSKMMIRHWTNFIKYGYPATYWPLYSNRSETAVYTSDRQPIISCEPRGENCGVWQAYFDKLKLDDFQLKIADAPAPPKEQDHLLSPPKEEIPSEFET